MHSSAPLSSPAFAAPGNGKSALAGSVPSWAQAAHKVGSSDKTTQVDFRVYLGNRGGDAAQQLATAVSTPGNAKYGQFLTAAQYRAAFSPARSDVDAVSAWLKAQGFRVGYVPDNHKYVEAVGSLAKASSAFGTSFSDYTVQGQTLRSNDTPLAVPSSLSAVEAVVGLDESAALVKHHATYQPQAGARAGQPCSAYWAEKTIGNTTVPGVTFPSSPTAFAPCGYAGAQLQGAYGVAGAIAGGNDGSGVTVAVIDAFASPTAAADLARYSKDHGLPAPKLTEQVAPGIYNHPTTRKWDPSGWAGEEQLDLEAVHTKVPGAGPAARRQRLAIPTLYATRTVSYDVTKAPLAQYPGVVRADYVNGENASDGTTFSARWFDYDSVLTIHVRTGYDDVTGVGTPNGRAWLNAVAPSSSH